MSTTLILAAPTSDDHKWPSRKSAGRVRFDHCAACFRNLLRVITKYARQTSWAFTPLSRVAVVGPCFSMGQVDSNPPAKTGEEPCFSRCVMYNLSIRLWI